MKGDAMSDISRRSFVQGGSIVAAGAATLGITGIAQADDAAENGGEAWDRETEILVCGFGGAGAVAAITAYDKGAQVLVIEKQPQDTEDTINQTNSTRLCYSAMMNFKDKQGAVDYLTAVSRGATPEDVIDSWADYATSPAEFLYSIGATEEQLINCGESQTEYPLELLPEGDNYDLYVFPNQGPELWKVLQNASDERGIEVLYETPLASLITDADGRVVGAVATTADGEMRIHATKAVILATGGFEYDFEMLHQYIWAYPTRYYANPGNTGDGIRAAQAVGADLWHMTLVGGRLIPFFEDLGFGLQGGTPQPFILVDKYGKRFMDEDWKSHSAVWESFKFSTDLADFPAVPAFSVFDQSSLDKGPVVNGGMMKVNAYTWSDDNSVEVEKGWILKGETIEELAELMASDPDVGDRMDPAVLAETLANYNSYAEAGEDPEFGRTGAGLEALETPPYYALKVYPGGVNTFGGPRRNAKGQIVRPDGTAIPGLYGAGEMGSVLGFLYSGGGWNVCELVCSGRLAADNAVLEG